MHPAVVEKQSCICFALRRGLKLAAGPPSSKHWQALNVSSGFSRDVLLAVSGTAVKYKSSFASLPFLDWFNWTHMILDRPVSHFTGNLWLVLPELTASSGLASNVSLARTHEEGQWWLR